MAALSLFSCKTILRQIASYLLIRYQLADKAAFGLNYDHGNSSKKTCFPEVGNITTMSEKYSTTTV